MERREYMERETWSAKYVMGIDEIDEQHRTLFDYVAKLDQCLGSENSRHAVQRILVELTAWSKVHFAAEEELMDQISFPELDDHIEMHLGFLGELSEFMMQSHQSDVGQKASLFLNDWLCQHIDKEDRKYAETVIARRASTYLSH